MKLPNLLLYHYEEDGLMKTTNLQVSFDADKLNALRFYMIKKDTKVEDELQVQLDRLYEKMVPMQVREYIEGQSEGEVPKQEAKEEVNTARQEIKAGDKKEMKPDDMKEEKSSEKQPRQSKRQREKEQAESSQAERQPEQQKDQTADPEQAEEENQGMSMSM